MNILIIGDIVGKVGVDKLKENLSSIVKEKKNRFYNCEWRKRSRRNGYNRKKL